MKKILERIKHEFLEVVPPTIFFFIAFCLIIVTKSLTLKQYGIHLTGFANALVGALIVGKVVLVIDKFSFMNKFPDKPLVYNITWKTIIYVCSIFIVRYLEHVIPLLTKYGDVVDANKHLWAEVVWPNFWLIQIWLSVLFFVFCSFREVVHAVGRETFLHMFLGLGNKT